MIITEKTLEVKPQSFSTSTVKVLSLCPVKHRFIKAECSVKAGLLTISNVLIVRSQHETALVAMPQRLAAVLTPTLQESITSAVLTAWNGGVA